MAEESWSHRLWYRITARRLPPQLKVISRPLAPPETAVVIGTPPPASSQLSSGPPVGLGLSGAGLTPAGPPSVAFPASVWAPGSDSMSRNKPLPPLPREAQTEVALSFENSSSLGRSSADANSGFSRNVLDPDIALERKVTLASLEGGSASSTGLSRFSWSTDGSRDSGASVATRSSVVASPEAMRPSSTSTDGKMVDLNDFQFAERSMEVPLMLDVRAPPPARPRPAEPAKVAALPPDTDNSLAIRKPEQLTAKNLARLTAERAAGAEGHDRAYGTAFLAARETSIGRLSTASTLINSVHSQPDRQDERKRDGRQI